MRVLFLQRANALHEKSYMQEWADSSGPVPIYRGQHAYLPMLHEHDFSHVREGFQARREALDESGLDPMNRPTMVVSVCER